MVPWRTALILLLVASGDAALLNRVAQRLSARRVRDALIAPMDHLRRPHPRRAGVEPRVSR